MIASIGQCVALVTHAQAWFEGREAPLDWRAHPWFAHTAEIRFGVGERGGPSAGDDPNAWFATLMAQGFRRAALFVEPFEEAWNVVNAAGFAGGLRMAPVTGIPGGDDVIWQERPRFDPVIRQWYVYRGGFRVMPGQDRLRATKADAGAALDAALARMIDFQEADRPEEPQWSAMFRDGRRQLRAAGLAPGGFATTPQDAETAHDEEIRARVRPLFPASPIAGEPDPRRLALVAAVEASWTLGGMGWWNDWVAPDEAAQARFRDATFAYYGAMIACLAAACEPDA